MQKSRNAEVHQKSIYIIRRIEVRVKRKQIEIYRNTGVQKCKIQKCRNAKIYISLMHIMKRIQMRV